MIEGYVNVADRISKPIPNVRGSFREKVAQGTFNKALQKNNNVELRYNHKRKLGDQEDGSLELREDNIGLYAKALVTDEEVIEKARKQELRGWSFGFSAVKDNWVQDGDTEIRRLDDINLMEVSILSVSPAYSATSISMRSDADGLVEYRASEGDDEVVLTEQEEVLDNQEANTDEQESDDEKRSQEQIAEYQEMIKQFKENAPIAKS